jgi:ATP-dependent helicase/nuclease subunit A
MTRKQVGQEILEDQSAREAIDTHLDKTMMVEAGAGSGKTTCLVKRMTALVAEGKAEISGIAAVTFTRKAAAELKERFQLALEKRFKGAEGERKELIERALQNLEQGFVGTIHSFCARLLRERPVEAGIDPGFIEMDELENSLHQEEVWEEYLSRIILEDRKILALLYELDVTLDQLKGAYRMLVLYPEVKVLTADCPPPEVISAVGEVKNFIAGAQKGIPASIPEKGWDPLQEAINNVDRMLRSLDPSQPRDFFRIIALFESPKGVTQNRWLSKEDAKKAVAELEDLKERVIAPLLQKWRRYRHSHLMRIIQPAEELCRQRRLETSRLNFQDLLQAASDLLKDNPEVRRYFKKRFSYLLVDEFQDTDPIQAEVMFYLSGENVTEKDWKRLRPENGSLFVVGDPKQSIYRFRRADIDTYNLVKELIVRAGGELVELRSNFRSMRSIGEWLNPIFKEVFPAESTPSQAKFSGLETVRTEDPSFLSGIYRITTPKVPYNRAAPIVEHDSLRIASWIRYALAGGIRIERTAEEKVLGLNERPVPSDFLVLLRNKAMIPLYAKRLEEFGIPFEVAGGNAFSMTFGLAEVVKILKALADPDSAVDLVAALRGLFFGVSDDILYRFRKAGGSFSFYADVPSGVPPEVSEVMGRAVERLRRYRKWTSVLPPSVAIEKIIEDVGLVPYLLNSDMGGSQTGNIMKVIEYLQKVELTGTMEFLSVVGQIEGLLEEGEMDEIDIAHGSQKAVRIMNLHKAKGLESPVVFLANPSGKSDHEPQIHIRRDADGAVGYFEIFYSRRILNRTQKRVIAIPPEWEKYAATEGGYASDEEDRILYVAGTRAKNALVVSTYAEKGEKNPWAFFDPHLREVPELDSPAAKPKTPEAFSISKREFARFHESSGEGFKGFVRPTYSALSVTSIAKETGSLPTWKRSGRGHSWGNVIHRALEAVMKGVEGKILDHLIVNFLIEEGRQQDEKETVLSILGEITESEFWKEAQSAEQKFVEVPFSLKVVPSDLGLSGDVGEYVILSGTIDLVYKTNDGWKIIDYKTDDVSDNVGEFVRYYAPQIKAYSRFWQEITGEKIAGAGLFFVKTKKIHYL